MTPRHFRDVYRDKCKMWVNVTPVKNGNVQRETEPVLPC
ncbi:hypothetical protein XBKB1_950004 [Xenorhabdus bovienii str. kraussei Becker Underwood]|uniref:Uncharacterized protein n=1 Tax=Xenorhabdus bovienii str. kraussei Becker Underwood TaxID=1398204 RepID=A0A077Q3Z8_XENBV|nr:hypothetical protein XBKB1_950004 [Xenorhabdus bovienii str. kraussei Becker Underwood]